MLCDWSVLAALIFAVCRYTDPSEMRINRDRSHPNRVDTYLKYYDANTDGAIHKHEFDTKHNDL